MCESQKAVCSPFSLGAVPQILSLIYDSKTLLQELPSDLLNQQKLTSTYLLRAVDMYDTYKNLFLIIIILC